MMQALPSITVRKVARVLLVVSAIATAGCLASACRSGDAVGAVTTAGLGAAGAGAYRATTGGCWGQCLNGLVCDRESGTCVAHPRCGGRCTTNERCEEGTVPRCVPLFTEYSTVASGDGGAVDAEADAEASPAPGSGTVPGL